MAVAWLDALLWSSTWLALACGALTAASARALGVPAAPALLALAAGGTFVVYVVDRLRDVERDRLTAPARAAFVTRHRPALLGLASLGLLAAAIGATTLHPRTLALTALVAGLGLAHRRLKRFAPGKPVYLTFAWTAVPVGLPAVESENATHAAWVAATVGAAVLANVALSNLRDREALAGRLGAKRTLRFAGVVSLAGAALALLAPAPVRPLVAVPLAMAAAVLGYRPSERYGALVVDGALLAGALAALTAS